MESGAPPTSDDTSLHSTLPSDLSPTAAVRRLSRQGSRSGGKVHSVVIQFEQVIAAQLPDKNHRTSSVSKGTSLNMRVAGKGTSTSPVLLRSKSSEIPVPPWLQAVTVNNASVLETPPINCHDDDSCIQASSAQSTEATVDGKLVQDGQAGKELLAIAEPDKGQPLEQDLSDGPQAIRYTVKLEDASVRESYARRRSDTEPLMVDMHEGGGNSSSDDSESSVDLLSSPSKDSNRGSKEIGEEDGLDKRSDLDKNLAIWVYSDFVPMCRTLLTDCTVSHVDPHQVLCDLRNVSNLISFFCNEHQRPTVSPSSPGLNNKLLSLPRMEQLSRPAANSPGPNQGTNDAQSQRAENVVIKVLRSASYGLMSPLLSLAQSEFNDELLKQIVQSLQKISWKMEACLSYSSPDQEEHHVHNEIFDGVHAAKVKDMMIKVQPPEEGKLTPPIWGAYGHGRSNSVAIHKTSGQVFGRLRSGNESIRSGTTKSTSLDDSDSSLWSSVASPSSPRELGPLKMEDHILQLGSKTAPGNPVTITLSDGGEQALKGVESEESSYFRPRVYRRTTVSLSRKEVDNLGLKPAEIGEWGGEEENHREKFYQIVGRNLNKRSTESVSEDAQERSDYLDKGRHQLSVSSSFEEVLMPHEEDLPSPMSEVTTPFNDSSSLPMTPLSPPEDFSYVPPPLTQVQAPAPRRPVKKTKSDLSQKMRGSQQKELQRVKSEKVMSVDMTQSLQHQHQVDRGSGGTKGRSGEKAKVNSLSKLISKHRSFGHSDNKKSKRKEEFIASPNTAEQEGEGSFFESIEHFSKEAHSSPPLHEDQLLVSVESATAKVTKSPRKKSVGNMWFEVTVTTNMTAQFGRTHYVIMRQMKAFQKLYDSLTKSIAGSVHQLPDMPDKKGGGTLDKKHRNVQDGLEALLRYIAGNAELRMTSAFKEFLTPDDMFGTVRESGSEVNFELLMTFYTPDEHVEANHSLIVISGEHSRPVTPTAPQNPKPSTLKRGSLHLMQRDGKEDPSTIIIREEGKDALIVSYENDRYVVIAGTFEKLVEQLACEEKPDSRFVTTFILGYRHVASGMDLLSHLTRRFRMKLAPNATEEEIAYTEKWKDLIQLRVLDVITFWVRKCWPDFYKNSELLEKTREFIASLKLSDDVNFQHAAEKMEGLIADKMLAMHTPPPTATPTSACLTSSIARPVSIAVSTLVATSPRMPASGPLDISSLSAIQLARQLTLIELDFLKALDMHELAVFTWESNTAVNKPFRRNLDAYIARFNEVSFWVATEVLSMPEPKSRGMLIEKFIDVAKHCLELKNYNTTISVASGLSLSAVRRLKKSWEFVSEKYAKSFQKLYQLTSPANNHTEYRRSLASISKKDNYIPYFGVFMRDLTFFNEGNHKILSNGLINFSKLRTLVLKFEEIKKCQSCKYFFPSEDKVKEYCTRLSNLSESDLYDKSEMLEPREVPLEHPETTDV